MARLKRWVYKIHTTWQRIHVWIQVMDMEPFACFSGAVGFALLWWCTSTYGSVFELTSYPQEKTRIDASKSTGSVQGPFRRALLVRFTIRPFREKTWRYQGIRLIKLCYYPRIGLLLNSVHKQTYDDPTWYLLNVSDLCCRQKNFHEKPTNAIDTRQRLRPLIVAFEPQGRSASSYLQPQGKYYFPHIAAVAKSAPDQADFRSSRQYGYFLAKRGS